MFKLLICITTKLDDSLFMILKVVRSFSLIPLLLCPVVVNEQIVSDVKRCQAVSLHGFIVVLAVFYTCPFAQSEFIHYFRSTTTNLKSIVLARVCRGRISPHRGVLFDLLTCACVCSDLCLTKRKQGVNGPCSCHENKRPNTKAEAAWEGH